MANEQHLKARRVLKVLVGGVLLLTVFIYLNNTSRFSPARTGSPTVFVHRGMAQQFNLATVTAETCTAALMRSPQHEYLENTIASMRAAFERGADVVEFDVNPTRDGQFAVFHDRVLDCRTDGHGPVREHSLEELGRLDVGYGYTADGGITYPFRHKGVGLMPSMADVFNTFPERSFLVDLKGNNPEDGALLAGHLSKLTSQHRSRLMVFGRETALEALRNALPDVRAFSTESITNCLVRYIAYGWTGIAPKACAKSTIFVPMNVMPWLWGWPNRFMDRFEAEGSSIIVMGILGGPDFPAGMDAREDVLRLPRDFNGGIWTNDVELTRSSLRKLGESAQ